MQLVATDLCTRLRMALILRCISTSRGMRFSCVRRHLSRCVVRSLFSSDLVWLELCGRYGLPAPPAGTVARDYFVSAQTSIQWHDQLQSGLGAAMMLTSNVHTCSPCARWHALQGHTSSITCISVDTPSGQVCTADEDGKLTVWDCERGYKLGKSGIKCCVVQLDL